MAFQCAANLSFDDLEAEVLDEYRIFFTPEAQKQRSHVASAEVKKPSLTPGVRAECYKFPVNIVGNSHLYWVVLFDDEGLPVADARLSKGRAMHLMRYVAGEEESPKPETKRNPKRWTPPDPDEGMTWRRLNHLFHEAGIKNGSLNVDGFTVTKHLRRYTSNSGKSWDWEVTFTWINERDETEVVTKPSQYKGNRRNDADRNWGLPE